MEEGVSLVRSRELVERITLTLMKGYVQIDEGV